MALVEEVVAETYAHLFAGGDVPKPDPAEAWATAWIVEERRFVVGVGLAAGDTIEDLWISKSHRGRGVGARLEAQIARDAHSTARLRVVASNAAARRFYRRHGWVEGRSYDHERWRFEMIDLSKDATDDRGAYPL